VGGALEGEVLLACVLRDMRCLRMEGLTFPMPRPPPVIMMVFPERVREGRRGEMAA
jgi:hypothetical protein